MAEGGSKVMAIDKLQRVSFNMGKIPPVFLSGAIFPDFRCWMGIKKSFEKTS